MLAPTLERPVHSTAFIACEILAHRGFDEEVAMEAARVRATQLDPRQLGLVGLLVVLAAVGWLVTGERMAGMGAGPGTDLGSLTFYVSAWVVMMAAMMFPSAAPMVVAYAHVRRRRRELGRPAARAGATALFVAGYLVSWTTFGLFAYGLFDLVRSIDVGALSWDGGGRYLAGGVIAAAAIYQLTPIKDACLSKCRGPFSFILGGWRDGRVGALRMGIEHGAWCVGCCWALMAALFAVGVMSVGWMVFIAALIALEKLLPWKTLANRGVAVLLVGLGLGVAVVPGQVPGLMVPGSSQASSMMTQMGGGSMKDSSMKDSSMKDGSMKPEMNDDRR